MAIRFGLEHIGIGLLALCAVAVGCAAGETADVDKGAGAQAAAGATTSTPTRPDGGSTSVGGGGGQLNCVEEICDGVDNDCDGDIDEDCDCADGDTQDCYTGDPTTRDVGLCQGGQQTCDINGKWGDCVGEVTPVPEACDGDDNDCNGEPDDGFDTLTCGQGVCQVTVSECVGGTPQQCIPANPPDPNEDCDGVDDDCDGDIDEGCNCTDNETQDCYTGAPSTNGVGICHGGTQTCSGGAWGPCVGEVTPGTEICDTIDQNCDDDISQGPCDLRNAISSCQDGVCELSSCISGFSNCDGDPATGCETQHTGYSNSPPGVDLGVWAADALYGFGCLSGGTCEGPFVTATSTQGGYMTIDATESSSCCSYISMRFELIVPPGVDYDLYLSGNGCEAAPAWQSLGGTGADEDIVVWCDDDCFGEDNSFFVNIEVYHYSGASCTPWELRVYRHAC